MKKYEFDDDQERDVRRKRSKRASNRPGEGMRIINQQFDDEYDNEYDINDNFYVEDELFIEKN